MRFSLKPIRALAGPMVLCAIAGCFLTCNAQDVPTTYPVRGVVLNSLTHRPIARALVDGRSDAALTGNDGRFEINLPEGRIPINVRRPGYNNPAVAAMMQSVNVGPNTPDLTFYLTPEASVSVHVTLANGDGADGIRFMVYRRRVDHGHRIWMMQGNYATDSDGSFRMTDLEAPGSYMLCSSPTQENTLLAAPGKTIYGYPPVCYPGVTDLSTAGVLSVSPGQQLETELTLTRQPFYPVRIVMPAGSAGPSGAISIHDQSWHDIIFPARFDSKQGVAQANLPNGHYYAESNSMSGRTSTYGRTDFLVTGGPVLGLSLVQQPLNPIAVEIHRDFTPNTAVGVLGTFNGESGNVANPGLNIALYPADSQTTNMSGHNLEHPASSADNGYFELDNVLPGSYWVQAGGYQGYVNSITSGGADLMREPLVVGPGGAAEPIEINMSNDAGMISATINPNSLGNSSSNPGEGVMTLVYAYAIPQFPSTDPLAMAISQSTGTLSFSNLAPGTYRVIAFDKMQEIDLDDPQAMARINSLGQTVTVDPGATASVQLDLVQTAQTAAEGSAQ